MENVSPGMRFIRTPLVTLLGNLCSDYILVVAHSGGGRRKKRYHTMEISTADLSGIIHTFSVLGASSGVAKARPGWAPAKPKFIPLMCV